MHIKLRYIFVSIIIVFTYKSDILPQSVTNITFSEVMFRPSKANSEFIEIFNLSKTDTVDLLNFKIKYQNSTVDIIDSTNQNTLLFPQSFAVIFEGDYDINNGVYTALVPGNALILKINNSAFGSSGMSNSSDRTIYLLNSKNDTIDIYTYSANNKAGYSDEKIILNKNNQPDNWLNSLSFNGTPGFENSVSPKHNDLEFYSLTVSPNPPFEDDTIDVTAKIKNAGLKNVSDFQINIYNDENRDSILTTGELFYNNTFGNLDSDDSLIVHTRLLNLKSGKYQLIGIVNNTLDQNKDNDTLFYRFNVVLKPSKFNDIVINEIMYKPSGDEPEWVELYNRSNKNIDLKYWRINDPTGSVIIYKKELPLAAKSYIVLAADSLQNFYNISSKIILLNLPSLNNKGDIIVLKDSSNKIIDSLNYSSDWGGDKGYSLERKNSEVPTNDSENWASSIATAKATPGKLNSVTPKSYDLSLTKFIGLKNYAVLGKNFPLLLKIKNNGLTDVNNFMIKIFNDTNKDSLSEPDEEIYENNSGFLKSQDSLTINTEISDFQLGENNLIAVIEFSQDEFLDNNTAFFKFKGVKIDVNRNDLVINEIMYAPLSTEPEWIELFNRSIKTINLKNFQIADRKKSALITGNNLKLKPNTYLVIAKDSSILKKYVIPSQLIVSEFSSLNNLGDEIILSDSLNRVIDSLKYTSRWGGNNGKSLERISPDKASIDSSNWRTSKSSNRATPGKINSVTVKDYDIAVTEINFQPSYPRPNENAAISVKVKNAGKQKALFTLELYEDVNFDSTADNLLEKSTMLSLSPFDSINYNFTYTVTDLTQPRMFIIKALFIKDEDTTNNTILSVISPGYKFNTIVINEIMFHPENGEPEWVELLNRSNSKVNLNNWIISDILAHPTATSITNKNLFLEPGDYIVLSKDSSIYNYHKTIPSKIVIVPFANLNNDEDGVVIKDGGGTLIDSVKYNSLWNSRTGYSLERKLSDLSSNKKENWAASNDIEQSTPGRINSIAEKKYDLQLTDISTVPSFPAFGEKVKISAIVLNNGNQTANNFSVRFYYDTGARSSFLDEVPARALSAGDTLQIITNLGFTLNDTTMLSAYLKYKADQDTFNNKNSNIAVPGYTPGTILISEVMYNPRKDEPEWVEFINNSNKKINLQNWSLSDVIPKPKKAFISKYAVEVKPGEYFIVASDSLKRFRTDAKIFISNFGTLSNNDGVVIYDFRDAVIDSLRFKNTWSYEKGFSTERLSFTAPTNAPNNWMLSLNANGGTPGMKNSITKIKRNKFNAVVINEILYNPDINNSEFVELYNNSSEFIELGNWTVSDSKNNIFKLSDTSMVLPPGKYFILSADSALIDNYPWLSNYKYKRILNSSLYLSNSSDIILLKDMWLDTIDSVYYNDDWNNPNVQFLRNKSLERLNPDFDSNDPTNWSTCVNKVGATPGKENSIFTKTIGSSYRMEISPNPFSPDNDGYEDFTVISYNLPQKIAQINIKIYDAQGRLVRQLANNKPSGSKGSIIFDGLSDSGKPLKIGIYIVYFEAINQNSGVVNIMKDVVVIARKL